MRIISRPWAIAGLLAASLLQTNGTIAAKSAPVVRVNAVADNGTVRLNAQSSAPFEYTTYRPSDGLFIVDLSGVSVEEPAIAKALDSPLVRGYRITSMEQDGSPTVRLEVLLRSAVTPRIERNNAEDLTVVVSSADATLATHANSPKVIPVSASTSDQGTSTESSASSKASIRDVSLGQVGEKTSVHVTGTSPLKYHVLQLQNPERIVLDFSGAQLKASEDHIASNLNPVREVRMAQFSADVTRVVIDLRQLAPFQITSDGDVVTVQFAAVKKSGTTQSIDSDEDVAAKSAPSKPIEQKQASEEPMENSSLLALPASLTHSAVAFASPLPGIAATSNDSTAAATPKAAEVIPSSAVVASIPPAVTAAAPTSATSAPAAAEAMPAPVEPIKYTGEPISVNLKDVDVRDFFRLIHEISSLNVVVDPAVKGNLTIVLDNVPWDQALDIVLQNNDLDKQLEGNVLRIATRETIKKEAEQARDLAKAEADAADMVTTTRLLSYAKATDLVITLKKFLTPRGEVLADSRSNTLIIRDLPTNIPVIDNLIRQLDRKTQQVEIEARVVAANRTFSRDLGSQLAFAAGTGNGKNVFGGNTTVGTSDLSRFSSPFPPLIAGTTAPTSGSGASMPLVTNLGAIAPTSGVSYLFSSANLAIDYIITAAEAKGVGKLLSKPKVVTQNNQVAIVKQGDQIPVQTVVNNTVSVQFVDVVLELQVTPQITADGNIFLDVLVTNNSIDNSIPEIQGIPAIATQSAQTKVLINDGGTVVIGGIIVSNQQTTVQQVPLVGSIPLLGDLFKHYTVSSNSQELLFFLTPRILPG
jgi:type IV pilus assembly protein PilQ